MLLGCAAVCNDAVPVVCVLVAVLSIASLQSSVDACVSGVVVSEGMCVSAGESAVVSLAHALSCACGVSGVVVCENARVLAAVGVVKTGVVLASATVFCVPSSAPRAATVVLDAFASASNVGVLAFALCAEGAMLGTLVSVQCAAVRSAWSWACVVVACTTGCASCSDVSGVFVPVEISL